MKHVNVSYGSAVYIHEVYAHFLYCDAEFQLIWQLKQTLGEDFCLTELQNRV